MVLIFLHSIKNLYKKLFLNNKFTLIGSAHDYKEIIIKEKQGVSLIFYHQYLKLIRMQKI